MVSRTSRKKSKGKDRKAKKEQAVRDKWLGWAIGENKATGKSIECNHGCGLIPNDLDHPVASFLNHFITYWDVHNEGNRTTIEMMQATFKRHQQVWTDESYKQTAVDILTTMGTNILLMEMSNERSGIMWAISIAKTIVLLDHHDSTVSFDVAIRNRRIRTRLRDLGSRTSSSRRDTLKFFSKRIPCSCLKKMHRKIRKTQPKIGSCWGCGREFERVSLSVCSRCTISQYCSRKCQVSDWPQHKFECNYMMKNKKHEQHTQIVDENTDTEG